MKNKIVKILKTELSFTDRFETGTEIDNAEEVAGSILNILSKNEKTHN